MIEELKNDCVLPRNFSLVLLKALEWLPVSSTGHMILINRFGLCMSMDMFWICEIQAWSDSSRSNILE